MSFYGSFSEAKSIISNIEVSENTHSASGSKILNGSSGPGGAASGIKPAGETMSQKRTSLRTSTSTLRRKYASTGSNS